MDVNEETSPAVHVGDSVIQMGEWSYTIIQL